MTHSLPSGRHHTLLEILDGCRGREVWVIGDLMLDEYVHGPVERISPEAPVPIVRVRDVEYRLGGAANVARQVAALGGRVALGGRIGVRMDVGVQRHRAPATGTRIARVEDRLVPDGPRLADAVDVLG